MPTTYGESAGRQLDAFLAKYTPEIAALARDIFNGMRKRLPGAVELVYDNYNALVVGFGPSEKISEAVFSIALYPRWATLFFLHGAELPDPAKRMQGGGKHVRHVVFESAKTLNEPAVRDLMSRALAQAAAAFDRKAPGRIVIKSVSAMQRPRRPPARRTRVTIEIGARGR